MRRLIAMTCIHRDGIVAPPDGGVLRDAGVEVYRPENKNVRQQTEEKFPARAQTVGTRSRG